MGTESGVLGTQDLEANTKLRHSTFSRAESTVVLFEVRDGWRGAYARDRLNKVPPGIRGGR